MSRPIIEATEHFGALTKRARFVVRRVGDAISSFPNISTTIWEDDYDEIIRGLKGSGFDVERGFTIMGKRIKRLAK